MIEGELRISSGVKYHWLNGSGLGVCGAVGAGDGPSCWDSDLGGEALDACVGGEGAGGGTSLRREGDRDRFWGTTGG